MRPATKVILGALLSLAAATAARAASPVDLREEQVTIPTYLLGPAEVNPVFYTGGNSQGAQHRIYPYPAYDNLTSEKADKKYTMVYLENEYIKVGILPEIGGKIFEAIDKTNHYDFFYHQHVIKPALISLLGAWISGGVEWDVPHHHRATSFLPVQYTTEKSLDGSATVWVGELELRDRTRWAVGITLHPGKAYIEASFRMINQTPLPVSMLCFSNVAVSVNDNYQVIFPPDTQHVTYHTKNQFTTWPMATGRFNNADFGSGVDASWYKNHQSSMSMFAWNFTDDFLAGYDHGKQAGTMAIADHNVVPGKKFWTWGNSPQGHTQDTLLTDSDGPYIELMVGAYSDNQPDYSWMQPGETRQWTQYWYPFRDIDGAKNANLDAAVNLEIKDGKAKVGFYATAERKAATMRITLKGEKLFEEKTDITPAKPWVKEITLPAGADEHDVRAALLDSDGHELIAYSPVRLQPEAMPAPVTAFPAPADIRTNEELYLAGLRNDQFRAPGAGDDPAVPPANSRWNPYWEEALKRDPADIRVNTAMGIECIRGGRFADAEKYLRTAVTRATDRYTTPKDTEPLYYLGLALKMEGKPDDAFSWFSKATWGGAWKSPAYFEMAQIASLRGDYARALDYTAQSLVSNANDVRALVLQSALCRKLNRTDQASRAAAQALAIDPLDVSAAIETTMLNGPKQQQINATSAVTRFPATAMQTAMDYANAGLWDDAELCLMSTDFAARRTDALRAYLRAYIDQQRNRPEDAAAALTAAQKAPTDYVFPFQMEMIPVLESAITVNPKDSHAPYYLGNLLYDSQPQRAADLWEKSAALGADFPVVYHNLAMVYTKNNQRDKALAALEKAASLGGSAMVFNELDKLYEEDGIAPDKRLAAFTDHQAAITRDEAIAREINLDIFANQPDAAIALMNARLFRAWEGGPSYSLGDSWINAHVEKGRTDLAAKNYTQALADFAAATAFPANMQSAIGNTASRNPEIAYWTGLAYEGAGDKTKAQEAFHDAAAPADAAPVPGAPRAGRGGGNRGGGNRGRSMGGLASGVKVPDAATYYRARALEKLGDAASAKTLFEQLAATPTDVPASAPVIPAADRSAAADNFYLAGLGHLGLGETAAALKNLNAALAISPDHLAAHLALVDLQQAPQAR